MDPHDSHCHHQTSSTKKKGWWQKPLFLTCLATLLLLVFSYGFSSLVNFRVSFFEYAGMIWLPILLGFILGGLIDYFIPQEYISKYLAAESKRTILYSTGLGFLMSA